MQLDNLVKSILNIMKNIYFYKTKNINLVNINISIAIEIY